MESGRMNIINKIAEKEIMLNRKINVVVMLLLSIFASGVYAGNENQITKGNNEFALNLYSQIKNLPEIKQAEGNLFFSPYSISTALAMTYTGARANTAKEMADVLKFPQLKLEEIASAFGELQKQLQADKKKSGYQLNVANALWGQKDFGFLPEFIGINKKYFGSGLTEVDFEKHEQARQIINTWVEKQTQEKIKELLPPRIFEDGLTRLVLTNAIYFKGFWETQFKTENTKPAKFNVTTDKTVDVQMMYQIGQFSYGEDDEMQLLTLPYKGNELSMLIILPKKIESFESVEQRVIKNNLPIASVSQQEVGVFLPKYKMSCGTIGLRDTLKTLGMKDAFDEDKADFSGMNGKRDLYISNVFHKAFVEVNEEGTEAAAATAVIIKIKSAPKPVPVFRADRPFIFMIRDNVSQSILFIGRVVNPTLESK